MNRKKFKISDVEVILKSEKEELIKFMYPTKELHDFDERSYTIEAPKIGFYIVTDKEEKNELIK